MPGPVSLTARWRRLPPVVVDALLAALVGVITIISVVVDDSQDGGTTMSAAGWALIAVQVVPLVWRRRFPVAVVIISITAAMAYGALHLPIRR